MNKGNRKSGVSKFGWTIMALEMGERAADAEDETEAIAKRWGKRRMRSFTGERYNGLTAEYMLRAEAA